MNSQTRFFMGMTLLILVAGIALITLSTRNQQPEHILPATVKHDCSPWDGAAFTLSMPYEPGSIINISIWQVPDIKLPARFSFPDQTLRIGNATLLLRFGYSVPLTGTVFFWHADPAEPLEGALDVATESGQRLRGKFKAEWDNTVAMCG